jgi:uncharacterized CHY-type Zn-finger protein
MKENNIICDMCNEDITYSEYITQIEFHFILTPKVDLCKKCSRTIYKLIVQKGKK